MLLLLPFLFPSQGTDTGDGENSNATEIWIGVVSSVIGGLILVLITKYCLKEDL